jgi:hypothetical protein
MCGEEEPTSCNKNNFRLDGDGIVAVIVDIEKMFHQVNIKEQYREALRFLWWQRETCQKNQLNTK